MIALRYPGRAETLIGKRVSHYEILEELGRGGMGVVYKALDVRLGRHVVLKFLHGEGTEAPAARKRFTREARTASQLDHRNILPIKKRSL